MTNIRRRRDGLYLVHLSIHGLVRGFDMELGRDSDTGGQVKYVVELARALGKNPRVARMDLLTRKVLDSKVDNSYGKTIEKLGDNSNIVRIEFGPKRYLRKEVLWPYLDEFTDKALQYFRRVGMVPDIIHGHYADGGLAGAKLAQHLGVPLIFTGHSLGRVKKARMMEHGRSEDALDSWYNMSTRIEAEEVALGNASLVITSTAQERDEQYKEYENYHPRRMRIIPPGIDLERFHPYRMDQRKPDIAHELDRFLYKPNKPLILALSRPDERKNITTLVEAYGESPELREAANLVIIAGNREDIAKLGKGARRVLTKILMLVDKYDLYGQAAYPKKHAADDVPQLYRYAARKRGVFVNPAMTEPFGLTLIEAGATGLPLVATDDGGPREIIGKCSNGTLIDPLDKEGMVKALLSLVTDRENWRAHSRAGIKGVKKYFSWDAHTKTYLREIQKLRPRRKEEEPGLPIIKSKLPVAEKVLITDIDNTLLGDREGVKDLLDIMSSMQDELVFGVATGRTLESTLNILAKENVPVPDILITSVGSEIYYGPNILRDHAWSRHITYRWKPGAIADVMKDVPGVEMQVQENQREFKLSYNYTPGKYPGVRHVRRLLRQKDLHAKMIHSHNQFLDFLPVRASKGLAIRYLCMKWGVDMKKVLVAGDSGNDREMLLGSMLGIVVGNYSQELKNLPVTANLYFANEQYARGIIEGMQHFGFLEEKEND